MSKSPSINGAEPSNDELFGLFINMSPERSLAPGSDSQTPPSTIDPSDASVPPQTLDNGGSVPDTAGTPRDNQYFLDRIANTPHTRTSNANSSSAMPGLLSADGRPSVPQMPSLGMGSLDNEQNNAVDRRQGSVSSQMQPSNNTVQQGSTGRAMARPSNFAHQTAETGDRVGLTGRPRRKGRKPLPPNFPLSDDEEGVVAGASSTGLGNLAGRGGTPSSSQAQVGLSNSDAPANASSTSRPTKRRQSESGEPAAKRQRLGSTATETEEQGAQQATGAGRMLASNTKYKFFATDDAADIQLRRLIGNSDRLGLNIPGKDFESVEGAALQNLHKNICKALMTPPKPSSATSLTLEQSLEADNSHQNELDKVLKLLETESSRNDAGARVTKLILLTKQFHEKGVPLSYFSVVATDEELQQSIQRSLISEDKYKTQRHGFPVERHTCLQRLQLITRAVEKSKYIAHDILTGEVNGQEWAALVLAPIAYLALKSEKDNGNSETHVAVEANPLQQTSASSPGGEDERSGDVAAEVEQSEDPEDVQDDGEDEEENGESEQEGQDAERQIQEPQTGSGFDRGSNGSDMDDRELPNDNSIAPIGYRTWEGPGGI